MGVRSVEQVADGHVESSADLDDHVKGWVAQPTLDSGQVRAMNMSPLGQLLLGEFTLSPT